MISNQEMSPEAASRLIFGVHLLIVAAIPALFILSPTATRFVRSTSLRFLAAIVFTWVLLNCWRSYAEAPMAMAAAVDADGTYHDGVGGNAAVFVFGWVEPLLFGLPFVVIKLMLDLTRNPKSSRHD